MHKRYRKIFSIGLVTLAILILIAGNSVLGNTKEPSQDLEKVKIIIEDEDAAVDWLSIYEAILKLGTSKDANVEEILVKVLRREKDINLTPDATLPNVMPPLEMLKAASIITLERIDTKNSIPDIERVYHSTKHQVLRDIAIEAIKNLNKR